MTSWPSVTGTIEECSFPSKLADVLTGLDAVEVKPLDDGTDRANLFALKKGKSRRTIVLTGHFDTVPFDDYGDLSELAISSDRLSSAIVSKLKRTAANPKALVDLESGAFIAGRGLLDMKAGLAAGIAAIEAYQGDLSLLFVAVCDEEERSAGARAAVPMLKEFTAANELDVVLVINLDAISDQGDGSSGRVVTFGSIGKQLVTAMVLGKQTHAGYPEDGVNAAYVAAELVTEFELSAELGEQTGTEVAAPPTALYFKDTKQGYNVTTPGEAWVYWNTMQHRRSGAEVFDLASAHVRRAVKRAENRTGRSIPVFSAAELMSTDGSLLTQDMSLNLPEQSRLATMALAERSGVARPAVIMGFGSIPYPAVTLIDQDLKQTIAEAAARFGVGSVEYFAGISDMSFLGQASEDLSVVAANTPIWGTGFTMPEPAGYPCVNIGPWGRDYHHWLERLHAPYAFEILPNVLLSVIDAVAKAGYRQSS